jgi:hypothetical protein
VGELHLSPEVQDKSTDEIVRVRPGISHSRHASFGEERFVGRHALRVIDLGTYVKTKV